MDFLPDDNILEFHPDTLDHVRNYFGLDKLKIEQSLKILEEWIEKQNHFVNKHFDKGYLERILIFSKGSIERAKKQLDKICTLRTLFPKYFSELPTKEDIKSVMDDIVITPLPKMTKDYARIYLLKMDHSNITPEKFIRNTRLNVHIIEYLSLHDYYKSVIIIQDFRGASALELMMNLSVLDLQQMLSITVEGYGMRLSGIHVISDSKVADLMMKFCKQFLNKKIASRLKIHDSIEGVYEYIDRSILPIELGGTDRSLASLKNEWIDLLSEEKNIDYVRKMNKSCTDENFRLEEKFNDLYLGTPGSFRNLTVD